MIPANGAVRALMACGFMGAGLTTSALVGSEQPTDRRVWKAVPGVGLLGVMALATPTASTTSAWVAGAAVAGATTGALLGATGLG